MKKWIWEKTSTRTIKRQIWKICKTVLGNIKHAERFNKYIQYVFQQHRSQSQDIEKHLSNKPE